MYTIYSTIVIAACAIIIIKIFIENKKLKNKLFNNEDKISDENNHHIENVNQLLRVEEISIFKKNINPEVPSKNSFLHGANNFGTMKKGVVLENNTYIYEKNDNSEFKPVIKKIKNKKW
jgi:hypothetical protein